MLSLVFGQFAEADLAEESEFLSNERGDAVAEKWLSEVFEIAEGLLTSPELGRIVVSGDESARLHAHRRRFTLVYTVINTNLVVLRVYGRGQLVKELSQ
jgi:plasmid stabilization system protein ParE